MIERMALTPQGQLWTFQHIGQVRWLFVFLAWCLSWLPKRIISSLIRVAQSCKDQPSFEAIKDYLNPSAVEACIHLAEHEMKEICDLDLAGLEHFKDRIRMLYGQSDGWAPVEYYHNLISVLPGCKAELAKEDIPHAFVLHDNDRVADIVINWFLSDNK